MSEQSGVAGRQGAQRRVAWRGALLGPLLARLFLPAPPPPLAPDEHAQFEALYAAQVAPATGGPLRYALPFPLHHFLHFLTEQKEILLHGSSVGGLARLEPRPQSDWAGRAVEALFATDDPCWPLFFALLARSQAGDSTRNAALRLSGDRTRYYFFSLNEAWWARQPWGEGTVYLLPRAPFRHNARGWLPHAEWTSPEAVTVLAQIPVAPDDFPFLRRVATHSAGEPLWASWLRYRQRVGGW